MSIQYLQDQGRDAHRRGDYAKALEHFNKAIGRGDPSPKLFNYLAATHLKLDDLDSALKAAKKAIRAGPEDPTGYLRAGIVLKKMERSSVALEIYAHGLKQIKHVGAGYQQLKAAHDELMKDLAPKNSVDPLTLLPRELAVAVLEYLTFRQRIAVCRVSKEWTRFIRSEPNLWAHLDLTSAKGKVKSSFVSVAINRAKSKLTSATLSRLFDFDKVLTSLVKCTPMTRLTLAENGLQGQNLVNILMRAHNLTELRILRKTEVREATLMQIVNALQGHLKVLHCAYVSRLEFRVRTRWRLVLPKLETLNITTGQLDGADCLFDELAKNAPELRSITVHENAIPSRVLEPLHIDLRPCTKLEYVNLRLGFRYARQLQLPPSVRDLYLSTALGGQLAQNFFQDHDATNIEPAALALLDLPHLEQLALDMPGLDFSRIANELAITQRMGSAAVPLSNLKSLSLEQPGVPEFGHFGFGPRLSKLEQLALRHTQVLKDEHVETIAKQLKDLKLLDLTGTAVTGVALRSVIKGGQVKELIVSECQNLGRDAVDLARSQGVKVECKMPSQETAGGKKIRY